MQPDQNIDKEAIRDAYDRVAKQNDSCCPGKGATDTVGFQPSYEHLEGHVPEADLGLGCGIPLAEGELERGQTVLDLGSGAGNDCFVARRAVGAEGRVIGVDFSRKMLRKARQTAADLGYENVVFLHGEIEELPVPDETIDVVISNCVINLVPDKRRAFEEIMRVLKSGGYFSVSDVVLRRPLPEHLRDNERMQVGCVAGALRAEEYLTMIRDAGFESPTVVEERDLDVSGRELEDISPSEVDEENGSLNPVEIAASSLTVRATKT